MSRPPQARPQDWRRAINQYIEDHPKRPLKRRALARELQVPDNAYQDFKTCVDEMLADASLVFGPGRTLVLPGSDDSIVGVLHLDKRGFGFIDRPGHPGVFVPPGSLSDAAHGDTVSAKLMDPGRRAGDPRARVVKVVKRVDVRWVGQLEHRGGRWFVRPQGRSPIALVEVGDPSAKSAHVGDLVVVEPLTPTGSDDVVRGVIIERLGEPTKLDTQIKGVIRRLGIPDEFPDGVREEASAASARLTESVIRGREDLRILLTITIDPVDARDFDDAITLERRADGGFELGVHIADVAFFIPPGSALDVEAKMRGTSVYFPGFVVPMLPEMLSNGVCSLQEAQPRLTKSAFITYDSKGDVQSTRFANSVIESNKRLTYEQVTQVLDGGSQDGVPPNVAKMLREAQDLAQRIRKRRLKRGMIVLNLPEVAIQLDENRGIIDAGPSDTSFSHTIIEMFMVEANEAVCRALTGVDVPHLRRIHPPPDPEAEHRLAQQLYTMGHPVPPSLDHHDIQRLLESVRGKPDEPAVNFMLLRTFAQATYSPKREGHFALASKDYCHFTSPIRRYPDLTIHRLLDKLVSGQLQDRRGRSEIESEAELVNLGFQCSTTERRAQEAERDVRSMLLLELMKTKIGETFDGIVWGISNSGVWVRTQPHMAEGVVPLVDLGDEVWRFSRESGTLVGENSGRVIMIGQPVKVRVASVNEIRQEMQLAPMSPFGVSHKRGGHGRGKPVRKSGGRSQRSRGAPAGEARGRSNRGGAASPKSANAGRGRRGRRR